MKKIQLFIITKSIGLYLNILSYFNLESAKNKAYHLFSQPRKGRIQKEKLPKTLQNATYETFEYENEKFQTYIWHGNQEVILLVHGWESNASRWKKLLNHLKPLGRTIIAIDAPAHGLSAGKEFNAPKYAEYINVLTQKYQPQTVIAHSVGGAAITYYLNKYKNSNLEKVVLLGAPSDFKILSDNFVKLLGLNDKIKSGLEDYYFQKFNIHINDFSGHKFAENFTQKAFIAHDIEDKVVLIDEGRKYANTWKNAIYIETKGLGHSMHDAELYQKIIDFI
ncbi:alpha/beta fold hydrolase [Flavobacterium sp.]|uniref:alpha/beta hydrolase n=1 Tax=Flavobacterium sp. TaxID=239 RepID=UPI0025DF0060|nr:alpha/beta fold hydrolase [Flavobacterium sp.]